MPRFLGAEFRARFPFATLRLSDPAVLLDVELTGWSPFTPPDADDSSLPVAGLEYRFTNRSAKKVDAVFSFNTKNFMATGRDGHGIRSVRGGFVLWEAGSKDKPAEQGAFAATVTDPKAKVNAVWFRGGSGTDGTCRTVVSLPVNVDRADVIVQHAGSRGPYTDEALRLFWGPFAPSARVTSSVAGLASLTVHLEDR